MNTCRPAVIFHPPRAESFDLTISTLRLDLLLYKQTQSKNNKKQHRPLCNKDFC